MSREIIGNSDKYIVDASHGINKDGFIAIGTESIVYNELKIKKNKTAPVKESERIL